jgi:para-aminobenzoate synthetase/4-amino-4-deoxychorismate lyase
LGIELLELHLERMKASAAELGFSFDRHEARNRIQAMCFELDRPAKLRLLLARSGEIALETMPLPPTAEGTVDCIVLPLPVVAGDWRLRHKSTDRGFYEVALAVAKERGAYETLFVRDDGLVTEGSFTDVFVERNGKLLTPPVSLGLLPGILRRKLLDDGRAEEARLTLEDLADGFLIGNATRGLIPARLA